MTRPSRPARSPQGRRRPLRSAAPRIAGMVAVLAAPLALAACGNSSDSSEGKSAGAMTLTNCGEKVELRRTPERIVLLKSASVPYLDSLGVLDRVVARAGAYPAEYYDKDTNAQLDTIETLTGKVSSDGHLQISRETVVGAEPDVVMGEAANLPRSALADVEIPTLEEPALCKNGPAQLEFSDVWSQLTTYGKVFDRREQAEAAVTAGKKRLAELTRRAETVKKRKLTAAVLYPTVGGGTTYAYGTRSMAHPQLEAAGLTNVFADSDQRVFEVSAEELIERDPDVIVALHSEGEPTPVVEAVKGLPGAGQVTAVKNGDVMAQLFNFTEPPSPLVLDGLEKIIDRFGEPRG